MKVIHTLKHALKQVALPVTIYQADLISRLLCAIIQTRSVNLKKLAASLSGSAQIDSHYRRLQRFFSSDLSPQIFSQLIVDRLVKPGNRIWLTLDRTHWKWGQQHQNLLCVGLLHKRVSIPIASMALNKAGNSNTTERKRLLNNVLRYLPKVRCCVLADREFIGKTWFDFLLKKRLDFVIRIRSNHWIQLADGREKHLECFTRRQPRNTTRVYENIQLYGRIHLHLICHRPAKGARLFLVTNRPQLHQAVPLYALRWSIETAFGFLKTKGFDLESTRLTRPDRLQRLLGLVAVALLWGLLIGDRCQRTKAIRRKKHGQRAISVFRLGLDHLQQILANIGEQRKTWRRYTRLLVSCS